MGSTDDEEKRWKVRSPLPKKHLALLLPICLIHDIDQTTIFSYAPKMIKSFGTPEVDVGNYSGLLGSSLYIGIFCCNLLWSHMADVKGKKRSLITSTSLLSLSMFLFGFSRSFAWALVTRLVFFSLNSYTFFLL